MAVHSEPVLPYKPLGSPLPHSLCSSAHRRSFLGRHWLGEWIGNQAFPGATPTLREEPTHHPSFCLPNVFGCCWDSNLSPGGGTLTASCFLAAGSPGSALQGCLIRFSPHFFEQIEEWEQRQPVRLVCRDERFNFPRGPGSWSRPPRLERGGCKHRHDSQLGP